jgi:hypothetical protein
MVIRLGRAECQLASLLRLASAAFELVVDEWAGFG